MNKNDIRFKKNVSLESIDASSWATSIDISTV